MAKNKSQLSLFFNFSDTLHQKHPLYILANQINWEVFEKAFTPLYSAHQGRPAKPIRLMVGLLILKHLRNLSDEGVVKQWSENNISLESLLLYQVSLAMLRNWYILEKG